MALRVLEELQHEFDCIAFTIVRQQIEDMILTNSQEFVDVVRGGKSPRQWILGVVSNIAGDHAESGHYHISRGILNPMGPGKDFVRIYDATTDELVRVGVVGAEIAAKAKAGLRKNIVAAG